MKILRANDDSHKEGGNLRNFDLSVEEIRLVKTIKSMTQSLEEIESKNSDPKRIEYFRNEIRNLEERLEDIRDNTLIR